MRFFCGCSERQIQVVLLSIFVTTKMHHFGHRPYMTPFRTLSIERNLRASTFMTSDILEKINTDIHSQVRVRRVDSSRAVALKEKRQVTKDANNPRKYSLILHTCPFIAPLPDRKRRETYKGVGRDRGGILVKIDEDGERKFNSTVAGDASPCAGSLGRYSPLDMLGSNVYFDTCRYGEL